MPAPFTFRFPPYPLWRRTWPPFVGEAVILASRVLLAADADLEPPRTPAQIAHYLARWRLLPRGMSARDARRWLESDTAPNGGTVTEGIDHAPPLERTPSFSPGATRTPSFTPLPSGEGSGEGAARSSARLAFPSPRPDLSPEADDNARMENPDAFGVLPAPSSGKGGEESGERGSTASGSMPLRLPAQWEPLEAVLMVFPVLYPPLWETHLQMIESIAPAAWPEVLLPSAAWARTVRLLLTVRGRVDLGRVRLVVLDTDDIWIRDYGPIVGHAPDGTRAAVSPLYDPLPTYPQTRDDAMPARWAAWRDLPHHKLNVRTEGGNLWSDGAGTLLMSDDLYDRNPDLARAEVERRLHQAFDFQKLIVTPKLWREETGHIDLLLKLTDAETVLVSVPTIPFNSGRLRRAAALLRSETNAAGVPYRVIDLPTPPPSLNWGAFPVWRSYTNALTVNGRVLVPIFGVPTDGEALEVYRRAMPGHTIIPIDCAAAANGGGAVHCLTHEIPA